MSSYTAAITPANALAIEHCLSAGRLTSYHPPHVEAREGESDVAAALRLYRWNAEIAAALWPVLHLFEVTARNAVADAVTLVHGDRWTHEHSFHLKLPAPQGRKVYNPRADLTNVCAQHPTAGKVIPEVKMIFWEMMFTKRHDHDFWGPHMFDVFPHLDPSISTVVHRNQFRETFEIVRRVRNRVGHHESIADPVRFDLDRCYADMLKTLAARAPEIAAWAAEISKVPEVLSNRPQMPYPRKR